MVLGSLGLSKMTIVSIDLTYFSPRTHHTIFFVCLSQ